MVPKSGILKARPNNSNVEVTTAWSCGASSPEADKIALKIYPFGIDCPIVLKELKLNDSPCHFRKSGNPVKDVDSVSSTE